MSGVQEYHIDKGTFGSAAFFPPQGFGSPSQAPTVSRRARGTQDSRRGPLPDCDTRRFPTGQKTPIVGGGPSGTRTFTVVRGALQAGRTQNPDRRPRPLGQSRVCGCPGSISGRQDTKPRLTAAAPRPIEGLRLSGRFCAAKPQSSDRRPAGRNRASPRFWSSSRAAQRI